MERAMSISLPGFFLAGFVGTLIGILCNPTPSPQQIWDASVTHYMTTAGDKATEQGHAALVAGYFQTVGLH